MGNQFTLVALGNLLLIGFGVSLVILGVWTVRGVVPKAVASKYPRSVLRMSQLPFTEKWRADVDSADLPLFLRARTRQFVFLLAALALSHVIPAYAYLHVVAEVRRCHMRELDLLGERVSPTKNPR